MRNCLLVAPMPTASTSAIGGCTESFERMSKVFMTRRTAAGEFQIIAKRLTLDLKERGLWNEDMRQKILALEGDIQKLHEIPADIRANYLTSFNLPFERDADKHSKRCDYFDQTASYNLHMPKSSVNNMINQLLYIWKKRNIKTTYYPKSQAAAAPRKTVDAYETKKNSGKKSSKVRRANALMKKRQRRVPNSKLQIASQEPAACLTCSS
jgi:ribonucleotide reductase alpha subunit